MRMHIFCRTIIIALLAALTGASGQCPGPSGDSFCQSIEGPSSYCVAGDWVCFGTAQDCGCNFSAPVVSSTTSTPLAVPQSTSGPSVMSTIAMGTTSPNRGTTLAITSGPLTSTTGSRGNPGAQVPCGSVVTQPLFVWAEWPDLYTKSEYVSYFAKLMGFVAGNCGNFRVTRIILRVTDPTVAGLFVPAVSSAIYTEFLSKLGGNVELKLYPYLYDQRAQSAWGPSGKPLEGVFKFAKQWNDLLASSGASTRFTGVVLDGEEKGGFNNELASVPNYKNQYGLASLGIAIGYDATGQVASYSTADEFYLELYDFYINNAPKLTLVQANTGNNTPQTFLDILDTNVLGPYVGKYGDSRFNFMWSVQAKSRSDCIYPLSGKCGTSDDFGWFTATNFNQFLQLVQQRYPVFAGRSHGIFQFSFVPPSWF